MEFRKATDELLSSLTAEDLAKEIGCSKQSVKQARMKSDSASYRSPPDGWEKAAAKLADRQAAKLSRLADQLRAAR